MQKTGVQSSQKGNEFFKNTEKRPNTKIAMTGAYGWKKSLPGGRNWQTFFLSVILNSLYIACCMHQAAEFAL